MHGDLNHTVNNTEHAPAQPEELELDIWLVLAGVLAVVSGLAMIGSALANGELTPRLVGVGIVLDGDGLTGPARGAACWLGVWQVWTASDLFSRGKQVRRRDRHPAQIALWLSYVPIFLALGTPAPWIWFCLISAAAALICLLRRPQAPRTGRRVIAAVVGVIAFVTWFLPEVRGLWSSEVDASVLGALAGTLLLLVIIVVPVHAVLTASAVNAGRTLRSWSICLLLKLATTWVVMSQWHVHLPAGSNVFSSFLPTIGVVAMLLASSSIRERVWAPGA
ncbi:hypothetical protein UK23_02545 [Lentzea aerocolonigenes]|uniref:Uncharacterized protein n=1 Tax=Lentzea aerocolonigenes TaxID=68170 RepID=A0A0F0HBD3_LENAE|nr:hypothetical protein UK23_02545 [Lentzea aerocolonigenes]